jgi:nucleolar protein 58
VNRKIFKFSPSKINPMRVHSIHLLEELNKETNNFEMKIGEWDRWHFHELLQTTTDNVLFAKIILRIGKPNGIDQADLSDLLTKPQIEKLKSNSHQSIGTDLADEDLLCIQGLYQQVLDLNKYRNQIAKYIRLRMRAIEPNLCDLMDEQVESRLIAHAGSPC